MDKKLEQLKEEVKREVKQEMIEIANRVEEKYQELVNQKLQEAGLLTELLEIEEVKLEENDSKLDVPPLDFPLSENEPLDEVVEIKVEERDYVVIGRSRSSTNDTENGQRKSVSEDSSDPAFDDEVSRDATSEHSGRESGHTSNFDETSMDSNSNSEPAGPKRSKRNIERARRAAERAARQSTEDEFVRSSNRKYVRDKALFDEMKFMADFDPVKSNRNRDKKRKRYTDGRPQVLADQYEDCDCLIANCPGCHYPCTKCSDTRCGHECRQGRRWLYESIENEGTGEEYRNQYSQTHH